MNNYTQSRIGRSRLNFAPAYSPQEGSKAPTTRASQRKDLGLFNNLSGLRIDRSKSAWAFRFNATRATAEGAAKRGYYVWRIPGTQDEYWALGKVD